MPNPAATLVIGVPATEAAALCIAAYEKHAAFCADVALPEETACLHELLKRNDRKEGGNG